MCLYTCKYVVLTNYLILKPIVTIFMYIYIYTYKRTYHIFNIYVHMYNTHTHTCARTYISSWIKKRFAPSTSSRLLSAYAIYVHACMNVSCLPYSPHKHFLNLQRRLQTAYCHLRICMHNMCVYVVYMIHVYLYVVCIIRMYVYVVTDSCS